MEWLFLTSSEGETAACSTSPAEGCAPSAELHGRSYQPQRAIWLSRPANQNLSCPRCLSLGGASSPEIGKCVNKAPPGPAWQHVSPGSPRRDVMARWRKTFLVAAGVRSFTRRSAEQSVCQTKFTSTCDPSLSQQSPL